MASYGNFFLKCKKLVKKESPYRTGNLRINAIKSERISSHEYKIYVDNGVAPYMPYTNEKWVSPRWNGKQNPNENWWDRAFDSVVNYLTHDLHGEVEKQRQFTQEYNSNGLKKNRK